MFTIEPAVEELETLLDGDGPDPYPVYARLRSEAPVAWSPAMNAWVVTRWDDVTRALEDEEYFGPRFAEMSSSAIYGRTILHMSGTEHRRKVAILAKRLRSPKRLNTDLRDLVVELVEGCGTQIEPAPGVTDLKQVMTSIVPLEVIGELMAMHEATAFPEWYHKIVAASVSNVRGDADIHARGIAAREEVFEFITPKIAEKRAEPTDDLLSDLVTLEYEGERLSDDEVRSFCAFLMSAGIETTDRAMVNLLVQLIQAPEQWQLLREDPELIVSAVAEGLRHRPPVHGAIRDARQDVELGGVQIPAGNRLFLVLGAANHDESQFDDPDAFDVTRFRDNADAQFTRVGPERSFGGGVHTCTGSLLAKVEMAEMLRYLLERFERLEFADGLPEDTGFYLRSPQSLDVRLHPAS
jgi:cytochrome P450